MIMYYLQLAFEKKTLMRAIRVAILVGIILNLINNPAFIFNFSANYLSLGRVLLTFMVPYMVSTYSSVLSNSALRTGSVSHIDAVLKCKSCNKTHFHVPIGHEVEECPICKKETRWRPVKIFSGSGSCDELLKSLALFARYNPNPLFRIKFDGIINEANQAAQVLFESVELTGKNFAEILPEIKDININQLIYNEAVKETIIHKGRKDYNLTLRGIPVLKSVQVYVSDITNRQDA